MKFNSLIFCLRYSDFNIFQNRLQVKLQEKFRTLVLVVSISHRDNLVMKLLVGMRNVPIAEFEVPQWCRFS